MQVSSSMRGKALEYVLTKGFSVIPVGSDKKPLLAWKKYQEALPLEDEVESWWKDKEETGTGLGIVTGKVSGITVVDIDVKGVEGGMKVEDFPKTYTVRTPSGGWHLYYEYDGGKVKNVARGWSHLPGVDVRNDGGYVVAPPTAGYEVVSDGEIVKFPAEMFVGGGQKRAGDKFSLSQGVGVSEGGRNQTMAQVVGSLLRGVATSEWERDVWEVVKKINKTYVPPLGEEELRRTFESVANREKDSRKEVLGAIRGVKSPVSFTDVEAIRLKLRGNRGGPYKDVTNAVYALAAHADWKTAFKYDTFKKHIAFRGREMKDEDIVTTQMWLQNEVDLYGIARSTVEDAVTYRAHQNEFNSIVEWMKGLEWDGVNRVDEWIPTVYGVENDEYHRAIGSNWLRAMVRRLVWPGTKYDHVLVIQGGQGVRKTTSFSVLGNAGPGDLHVETTIRADSKDFLMQFDGRAIVEFSEGETLNRSETKALKAIITRTHDKYRAPYTRTDQEHPRQCVFCMTTNDTEYLKDDTGNRRWLIVKMDEGVKADIDWLEENRDQLFAEAYARREEPTWIYPEDKAMEMQEGSRMVDAIEDEVVEFYESMKPERREEGVTVADVHAWFYRKFPEEKRPVIIDRGFEWRVKSIFKSALRLDYARRRRGDGGERVRKWFPTVETTFKCPYKKQVGIDFEE